MAATQYRLVDGRFLAGAAEWVGVSVVVVGAATGWPAGRRSRWRSG
jgi:hypothetical protein